MLLGYFNLYSGEDYYLVEVCGHIVHHTLTIEAAMVWVNSCFPTNLSVSDFALICDV